MNTLSGASNNERDTQDKSPEEPRQEHDTQDTPMKSLETQNPTCPGGPYWGVCVVAMGCPSQLDRSRASSSSIHRPCSKDEERGEVIDGKRVKER